MQSDGVIKEGRSNTFYFIQILSFEKDICNIEMYFQPLVQQYVSK